MLLKTRLALVALPILLVQAAPAASCAAIPDPFRPTAGKYDIAIIGVVTGVVETGRSVLADIKILKVRSGQYKQSGFTLHSYVYDGRGMCPPPGPLVRNGQAVIVYLRRKPPMPEGWPSGAAYSLEPDPVGWFILADAEQAKTRWDGWQLAAAGAALSIGLIMLRLATKRRNEN